MIQIMTRIRIRIRRTSIGSNITSFYPVLNLKRNNKIGTINNMIS
jgi:hypothetical protein